MLQFPPTPTPFPPGEARFDMPTEYSLWGSTDMAIQLWNWLGDMGNVVQLITLILLVLCGIFITYRFVKRFTGRDAVS